VSRGRKKMERRGIGQLKIPGDYLELRKVPDWILGRQVEESSRNRVVARPLPDKCDVRGRRLKTEWMEGTRLVYQDLVDVD
jgi:hypothetical protein